MRSASSVNPRMSESQIAARIVSLKPRRMLPARMRAAAQRIIFGDSGERRDQRFERRAVSIGETARMTRRPGPDMHLAIAELDRHRDVFGAAFGAQFIELRKGARFGA